MTWNYRVMEDEHGNYGIVEAFYNADGEIFLVTEEFMEPFGETLEDLLENYRMMKKAFSSSLLKYDMEFAEPDWCRPLEDEDCSN